MSEAVASMAIMVDPDGMREVIFNVICKIREESKRINVELNNIEQSLGAEFCESNQLYNELKKINNKLENIISVLSNCENFIDSTILDYLNANKKIDTFVNRIISKETENRHNIFKESFSEQEKKKDVLPLSLISNIKEKPCKLPQKDCIIKTSVNAGKIDGGKNILVRAWKTRYHDL